MSFFRHVRHNIKAATLRRRYLNEVNDPALRLPPRPPKPRHNDKRRPTKPR